MNTLSGVQPAMTGQAAQMSIHQISPRGDPRLAGYSPVTIRAIVLHLHYNAKVWVLSSFSGCLTSGAGAWYDKTS